MRHSYVAVVLVIVGVASLCIRTEASGANDALGSLETPTLVNPAIKQTPGTCTGLTTCESCQQHSSCGWCGGVCQAAGPQCAFSGKCDGRQVYGQDVSHHSLVVTAGWKNDDAADGRVVVTADVVGEADSSTSGDDSTLKDEAKLRALEHDELHSPLSQLRAEIDKKYVNREDDAEDENPDGSHSEVETHGMIDDLEGRLRGLEAALTGSGEATAETRDAPDLDATKVDEMKQAVLSRIEEATADHMSKLERKLAMHRTKKNELNGQDETVVNDEGDDDPTERMINQHHIMEELAALEQENREMRDALNLRANHPHPEDARNRQLLVVLQNRINRAREDLLESESQHVDMGSVKSELAQEAEEAAGEHAQDEKQMQEQSAEAEKAAEEHAREEDQESAHPQANPVQEQLEEDTGVKTDRALDMSKLDNAEAREVVAQRREVEKSEKDAAQPADSLGDEAKALDTLEKQVAALEQKAPPLTNKTKATPAKTGISDDNERARIATAEAAQLLREATGSDKAAFGEAARAKIKKLRTDDTGGQLNVAMEKVKAFFHRIISKESGKTAL